ncbi:hypothetical protein J2Z79_001911 [Symbiobacterium terraclitae]|uniref:Anti-sigma-W factor RsiW n=1 Tax=Symbiobacterium terraclitae TaxID=557451 RepID=A0ABS4JSK7_9FIRM|nr:zf-HC2 domain-containing protein [Symbiobacterium terraclitae]MBP2018500.1 hypothetical protein [Symbiobacterium terraclitae]
MEIDLCALTEDLLPLYADGLLSPATRQVLERHAAGCPACRQRLRAGAIPPPPAVPPAEPRVERAARDFFGRLRRLLFGGLAAAVALMVLVGSLSYTLGRQRPAEARRVPFRVAGAGDLAARAIPGWERASAAGLVADLGITERIPGTDAAITLERAWFSGRQVYVLYTVRAPEGGHWLPAEALLRGDDPERPHSEGRTDWNRLSTWGGFSREGFHSVLIFRAVPPVHDASRLELVLRQWARVSPGSGVSRTETFWADLRIPIPWDRDYLTEPAPDVLSWPQQHTWLGRTLALDTLEVGVGRTQLTGEITLPEGERDPVLMASLIVGGQELGGGAHTLEPAGEPGRYRFTATFDGPNRWPAPVQLRLHGIGLATDQTLKWTVNWAKYRGDGPTEDRLMDPEDQVTVRFYDSELISIYAHDGGVAIEQRDPERKAPYVRAHLGGHGRGFPDDLGPGFEVENDAGEVITNLGGGGGAVYGGPGRNGVREGVAVMWWDELPEAFRQSYRLIIRYVQPSALLVLDETWTLTVED